MEVFEGVVTRGSFKFGLSVLNNPSLPVAAKK